MQLINCRKIIWRKHFKFPSSMTNLEINVFFCIKVNYIWSHPRFTFHLPLHATQPSLYSYLNRIRRATRDPISTKRQVQRDPRVPQGVPSQRANPERPLDLVTGFQGSSSTRSERSPLDSRLSKDSNEEKRAAIPTSPVLTPTGKIFPR